MKVGVEVESGINWSKVVLVEGKMLEKTSGVREGGYFDARLPDIS